MELSYDDFQEYLAGLDDRELEDMRHTLVLVDAESKRRQLNADLASVAAEMCPDADPGVFSEAVVAICRAQHELDGKYCLNDAVIGATDIAEARAGVRIDDNDRN